MSTTTARKSATRMPATSKPAAKAAPKEQKTAPVEAKPAKKKPEPKPEPKTLIDALTTGQAALIKVRANKTTRSLPYLAVGTEERKKAEAVAKMREDGATVDAIAESLNVSTATARRFLTNLALARAVEAGQHDKAWSKGVREVIVHTVEVKKA